MLKYLYESAGGGGGGREGQEAPELSTFWKAQDYE